MDLDTGSKRVRAVKEGPIGWLVYDNPARHNALSAEMQAAAPVALDMFQRDEEIRVVVMRGAGERSFVSGADISEFEQMRATPESRRDRIQARARAGLAPLEKPLLAMIHGYCIGGGLATALSADIRIAADDAQFAIPAARLGLGYPFPGIEALVGVVGAAYASEILLSARRFSAEEALQMRLVNRVVPKAELEDAVRELALSIAANAPLTVRASRFAIRQVARDPGSRDLERCNALVEDCFRSDDYVEGRRAFMEKRPPLFQGR